MHYFDFGSVNVGLAPFGASYTHVCRKRPGVEDDE
jgi:hypothetical protein